MRTDASPECDRRLDWHGGSRTTVERGERGSLVALRTRLSAGVPLSQAPAERAILPNVVLRLEAAGAAKRTVDSRGEGAWGVDGVGGGVFGGFGFAFGGFWAGGFLGVFFIGG